MRGCPSHPAASYTARSPDMSDRSTNLLLLVLLAAAAATGVLAFALGTVPVRAVLVVHGIAGIGIVVLAPWKAAAVRRGMHRARPARWVSITLVLAVVVTIATGIGFSLGVLMSLGPLTTMQVHVASGVFAVVLGMAHVLKRPQPIRAPDLRRRALLRLTAVGGLAAVTYVALARVTSAARLPGADRRFTGSHERGSFDPGAMPVTSWINDTAHRVDPADYRLTVENASGTETFRIDQLAGTAAVRATLDCTGGWYATQDWQGTPLAELLDGTGQSIRVISATGYERRFPVEAAPHLLLATDVAGEPISVGHGAPVRLVAPGRRGFWWVKWVERIVVDDRPSWWQPPFPLT